MVFKYSIKSFMKNIIFCLLMLLGKITLNAQEELRNDGNLRVHNGAYMSSKGNFTNSSTASLVNNGSLYIKRNLTNDEASMSAGTGTLYLNGTTAQIIAGSQAFKTYNLVSDNST